MKKIILLPLFLSCALLAAETPVEKEFVTAFFPTEINLNPLNSYTATEAQIYTALYEGLVTYDPASLDPLPGAARSWEITGDGKTYTFRIRDDARYDNGDPVTAEDFRKSWLKFLDPKTRAEYSFLYDVIEGARDYRTGKNADPESVRITALAPNRLQVVLEEPATHFLKILCHHSFVPIHPSLLDIQIWEAPFVVGNGPYRLAERRPGLMLLEKNPHYWDAGKVAIPRLRLVFVDDPVGVTQRFNDYEIHWVADGMALDKVLYQDTILVNPLFATQYFYFSNLSEPWSDARVRRALALLAPWREIRSPDIQFIPAKTLVPSIPNYPSPETIDGMNKTEAYRLLEETGYPGGEGLPTVRIMIPEGDGMRRIAALFAASWKEHSIDSEIVAIPYPRYFEAVKGGDYTLGTVSWIGDFADPLTFLLMWTTSSNLNDGKFSDPEFDELIRKSMRQSGAERYKTLSAAESLILKGGQVLPVGHSPAINLIDLHYVDGWYRNPLDLHPFKYLSFAPYKPLPGVVRYDPPGL